MLSINIVLACKYIGQSKKKCFKFSRALRRMNGDVLYVFEWGEWTVMYNVFEWGEWTVMYYMCLAVRRVNGDVYMCLSEESERWCIMCLRYRLCFNHFPTYLDTGTALTCDVFFSFSYNMYMYYYNNDSIARHFINRNLRKNVKKLVSMIGFQCKNPQNVNKSDFCGRFSI